MSEVRHIYQGILDVMTAAILSRDSRTWCAHIMTPHLMATSDGRVILETTEQVVTGLETFADSLARMDVVNISRECETARLTDPSTIVGYHTNRLTRRDGTTLPPYQSKWVLQKLGDAWRLSKSESALSVNDAGWTILPHTAVTGYRDRAIDSKTARNAEVQQIIDRLDTIFVSGDYEGWRRAVNLPLTIEASHAVQVIRTEEELSEDFDLYLQQFKINRVTDITRQVMSVSMLEPDQMMCHYRVHVLNQGTYVVPPWDAATILLRIDDTWRISTIKRALGHLNWIATHDRDQL